MSRAAQSSIVPSPSCVTSSPATLVHGQLPIQSEAASSPQMPVTDLEPGKLGPECPLCPLMLYTLGPAATVSSSESLGSTPQNRENRIVTAIAETREGQWLPGVTPQASGKHARVLAPQPQTAPTLPTPQPPLVWGPRLGPASCWRPGLYNLAAGLHGLRNHRPPACSGLDPGPPWLFLWPDLASPGALICPFSPFPPT